MVCVSLRSLGNTWARERGSDVVYSIRFDRGPAGRSSAARGTLGERDARAKARTCSGSFNSRNGGNWQAGDRLAVSRAVMQCTLAKKPLPAWLCRAIHRLCMPDVDQRACADVENHSVRWQAVELVRGRCPGNPRNYDKKKKLSGYAVYEEAAELAADMRCRGQRRDSAPKPSLDEPGPVTVNGDKAVTLQSYKRASETARSK